MVQVLPFVPGFGEQLAQSLAGAAGNISQGILQRQMNQADQRILNELGTKQNASPMEYIQSFGKLSSQKQQTLSPIISQIIKSQGTQQLAQQQAQAKLQESEAKKIEENKKLGEEYKEWQSVFDTLDKKAPYTGYAVPFTKAAFAHIPWSEAAKHREAFDVAAFQLERYARAAHTKGALSTKVYESLLSKLPDSKIPTNRNRGRIEEWKKTLLNNPKYKDIIDQVDKESATQGQANAPQGSKVDVYDASGKLVGRIDPNQAKELPQGFVIK